LLTFEVACKTNGNILQVSGTTHAVIESMANEIKCKQPHFGKMIPMYF